MVSAKCANDCSNHGDCNAKNQCECHRNYFGPDCSRRLCPAGRSFIDSAVGDVNGDNSVGVDLVFAEGRGATPVSEVFSYKYGAARDSFDVTASWNEAHFYQECSSKGVCDTTTGQCDCFPGYEGSGCARKSCENDCSGHGACKNYAGTTYNMWDKDATLYCDCDAGYSGPGCELRVCPSGVDPVQASNLDTSRFYQIGFKTLTAQNGDFTTETFYSVPYGPVTWTITLTDEYGDEWTTSLLTTNYDVIEDTTNDVPLVSLPVIAGAKDDNVEASDAVTAADIPTVFNSFGDGSNHVADQVKTALEALPNSASGTVTVHEIYAQPIIDTIDIGLLSSRFPAPFTGSDSIDMAWPAFCGRYDIYVSADDIATDGAVTGPTANTIAGCGVAVEDTELGTGACVDRSGNQDIEDFLWGNGAYSASTVLGLDSSEDPKIVYDVGSAGTETVLTSGDVTTVGVTSTNGDGTFLLYAENGGGSDGTAFNSVIYYQYPHFSNGDGAESRFPLFEDLATACADVTGYYAAGSTYHNDILKLQDDSIPGLSLFLYFNEATIETTPRVDFSFNNQAADAYLVANIFNGGTDGIGIGETVEGINDSTGDYASHSLVEIASRGGERVWDVAYHGRQAYFLDDGSDTADGVMAHMCSKRGLCDYSTGLCDCFSGFTGANCAEQNALAY